MKKLKAYICMSYAKKPNRNRNYQNSNAFTDLFVTMSQQRESPQSSFTLPSIQNDIVRVLYQGRDKSVFVVLFIFALVERIDNLSRFIKQVQKIANIAIPII